MSVPGDAPEGFLSTADLIGMEIAGCRIISKLGQGAMGTVYLAEQLSLSRMVAFKVLNPENSRDKQYIERFEREAQSSARLGHFNVVPVYDFGRAGGIYYIISGYIDGTTVQKMIEEKGVIPAEQATNIMLQAARGLAAAEEVGLVHRDIKPDNLMVDKSGVVKIADFGLAKVVKEDASITQAGMIVGTPYYISPEQAQGRTLDIRSDIYSLGVTYYHLVAGQVPFDAETVITILLLHVSAERPNASSVNASVPPVVSNIIIRMMAREPEKRFASAKELVSALTQVLAQLKRGEGSVPAIDGAAAVDRQHRYKRLRSSMVLRLSAKGVTPEALEQLKKRCASDSGIFVETNNPLPVDTVVELRFVVPGKESQLDGVGLVRWLGESGQPGMGIVLLSIKEVLPEKPAADNGPPPISCAEIISNLTRSPLHCRLLRFYYSNSGRNVRIQQIANSLGVGARILESLLHEYFLFGLAVEKANKEIAFIWPDADDLQAAILDWLKKYGLK